MSRPAVAGPAMLSEPLSHPSALALVQAEHHLPAVVVFRNDEGDLSVALTWNLAVLRDQDVGLRARAAAASAWRIARPSQEHGEPAARAAELCVVWAVFVIGVETLLHALTVCKSE